VIDLDILHVLV
jgi:hypothetical protein